MKRFPLFARVGTALILLGALLAACTSGQSTPFFPAPEFGEVTFDGDTITITGSNFFEVLPGSTLPTNLTISVCGELLGNLVLNGETKTVMFAPGTVATITTATKIIGTLTGVFVGEHDGIRITNPDGQTINIDVDCDGEPEIDPNIFQVTVDFSVVSEEDYWMVESSLGPEDEPYTTFYLPLTGTGTIVVDWGDGSATTTVTDPYSATWYITEELVHEYDGLGPYKVTATGDLTDARFGLHSYESGSPESFEPFIPDDSSYYGNDRFLAMAALVSFDSWGTFEYNSSFGTFSRLPNLISVPNYLPAEIDDLSEMFYMTPQFNSDISGWDVGNVTSMHYMFQGATSFNQDIGTWDVQNVRYMGYMFDGATSFNQDLDAWETNSLTSIWAIFRDATAFNGKIGTWDVSDVWDFDEAFSGATMFNQDIGDWNVENAEYASSMFYNATSFDQDLSDWCFVKLSAAPSNFNLNSPFASNSAFQPQWACTLD